MARLHSLELSVTSLRDELHENRERLSLSINQVNNNVRRIAIQPVVRRATARNAVNAGNVVGAAILSPLPRNLHILWQEYTVGLGGRKAARLFTAQERGRNKYKFHRRKVVWEVIDRLVRSGQTADAAIDMIYDIYGHVSVTSIINRMRQDRANGGHVNLR